MDVHDPYKPPEAVDANAMFGSPAGDQSQSLGSLAQSARGKELKQARGILIFVGIVTLAANGFMLLRLPQEVQAAIQQNNIAPENVAEFRQTVTGFGYVIYGGAAAVGLVFLVFGIILQKFPVPITILSLVLYVAMAVVFGMLNPESLAQGLIVKIVIVVALLRAIKAARAYASHTRKVAVAGELLARSVNASRRGLPFRGRRLPSSFWVWRSQAEPWRPATTISPLRRWCHLRSPARW